MATQFNGFPQETVRFLAALEQNNNRQWFTEHKAEYDKNVLGPAQQFVLAMGERLRSAVPEINADPRVDKTIFRIHRDTRFSKDKRPYKTHLAIFFWHGEGKKLESPGFYFHLEKDKLLIGGGMHILTKTQLIRYRELVDDPKTGIELEKILAAGAKQLKGNLSEAQYKRVPRGYPTDHPRAELLKYKGVTLGEETTVPAQLHRKDAVDYVYRRFEVMLPMHRWLLQLLE